MYFGTISCRYRIMYKLFLLMRYCSNEFSWMNFVKKVCYWKIVGKPSDLQKIVWKIFKIIIVITLLYEGFTVSVYFLLYRERYRIHISIWNVIKISDNTKIYCINMSSKMLSFWGIRNQKLTRHYYHIINNNFLLIFRTILLVIFKTSYISTQAFRINKVYFNRF